MAIGMIFWPMTISVHHPRASSQMYPLVSFHPLYHHSVPSSLPRGRCRRKPLSPNKKGTRRNGACSVSSASAVCVELVEKGWFAEMLLVGKVTRSLTGLGRGQGLKVCRPGLGTRSATRSVCWVRRLEKTGHSVKMSPALVPITPFPGPNASKLAWS